MKNIFISSLLMWQYPVDQILKKTKALGINGVEIWVEQIWYYKTPLEKIISNKNKYKLDLTLHAPSWDINLCALNKEIRQTSINEIKKAIKLTKILDAKNITIHPGKLNLASLKEWHFQKSIESIAILANYADKHNVFLSIEQMEYLNKEYINNPTIMNKLLSYLPESVGVTFDVAHLNNNNDFDIYFNKMKKINKAHISNRLGNKLHTPCDEGELNCESFINKLSAKNIPLVIEGFDNSNENQILERNISFLKKIYAN